MFNNSYQLGSLDPSGAAATWRASLSKNRGNLFTSASSAAEYRFQGNQPKIQNAYNYKKRVVTGIRGVAFDQQADDKYWQSKQIQPTINRPLGAGIRQAMLINEGIYNINPIAGTNSFGGGVVSRASGLNPTNYSISTSDDIEDRLRAHAVPASDPMSAEFAKALPQGQKLDPGNVEGDAMVNTFASDQSIARNAKTQVWDSNLFPADNEEDDGSGDANPFQDKANTSLEYIRKASISKVNEELSNKTVNDILAGYRNAFNRNYREKLRMHGMGDWVEQAANPVNQAGSSKSSKSSEGKGFGSDGSGGGGGGGGSFSDGRSKEPENFFDPNIAKTLGSETKSAYQVANYFSPAPKHIAMYGSSRNTITSESDSLTNRTPPSFSNSSTPLKENPNDKTFYGTPDSFFSNSEDDDINDDIAQGFFHTASSVVHAVASTLGGFGQYFAPSESKEEESSYEEGSTFDQMSQDSSEMSYEDIHNDSGQGSPQPIAPPRRGYDPNRSPDAGGGAPRIPVQEDVLPPDLKDFFIESERSPNPVQKSIANVGIRVLEKTRSPKKALEAMYYTSKVISDTPTAQLRRDSDAFKQQFESRIQTFGQLKDKFQNLIVRKPLFPETIESKEIDTNMHRGHMNTQAFGRVENNGGRMVNHGHRVTFQETLPRGDQVGGEFETFNARDSLPLHQMRQNTKQVREAFENQDLPLSSYETPTKNDFVNSVASQFPGQSRDPNVSAKDIISKFGKKPSPKKSSPMIRQTPIASNLTTMRGSELNATTAMVSKKGPSPQKSFMTVSQLEATKTIAPQPKPAGFLGKAGDTHIDQFFAERGINTDNVGVGSITSHKPSKQLGDIRTQEGLRKTFVGDSKVDSKQTWNASRISNETARNNPESNYEFGGAETKLYDESKLLSVSQLASGGGGKLPAASMAALPIFANGSHTVVRTSSSLAKTTNYQAQSTSNLLPSNNTGYQGLVEGAVADESALKLKSSSAEVNAFLEKLIPDFKRKDLDRRAQLSASINASQAALNDTVIGDLTSKFINDYIRLSRNFTQVEAKRISESKAQGMPNAGVAVAVGEARAQELLTNMYPLIMKLMYEKDPYSKFAQIEKMVNDMENLHNASDHRLRLSISKTHRIGTFGTAMTAYPSVSIAVSDVKEVTKRDAKRSRVTYNDDELKSSLRMAGVNDLDATRVLYPTTVVTS